MDAAGTPRAAVLAESLGVRLPPGSLFSGENVFSSSGGSGSSGSSGSGSSGSGSSGSGYAVAPSLTAAAAVRTCVRASVCVVCSNSINRMFPQHRKPYDRKTCDM